MSASDIDFSDIQGLVRFGYGSLTEACFLLMRVRDAGAARAWLSTVPVTNAVYLDKAPQQAVQIAFTASGLLAVGLSQEVLTGFADEFCTGLAGNEARSRRLGDVGANAPENWLWGGNDATSPHLALLLYSLPGGLENLRESICVTQWDSTFVELACLPTANLHGLEPFGFPDGISQPEVDWQQSRNPGFASEYTNRVMLGEFLLGYPNEYGKYTDRPTASLEGSAGTADLGKNGTYLVFRHLQQDVRSFWQFAEKAAEGDPLELAHITSAMIGRKRTGEPLAPLETTAIAGIEPKAATLNNFTYASDSNGFGCPLGSHIRRANPRNADMPTGPSSPVRRLLRALGFPHETLREDVISSTRFHRLLRRGREYGPYLSPEDALSPAQPDEPEQGIYFLCLNANIARQFEFVQTAWMMNSNFDGLPRETDPLLGPRCPLFGGQATNSFSIPGAAGLPQKIEGMPRFVTVRGGAYFFLPSISTIRHLSQLMR